jgi:hypothetical protein
LRSQCLIPEQKIKHRYPALPSLGNFCKQGCASKLSEAAAFRGWPEAVRASNTHCMWSYIGANMGMLLLFPQNLPPLCPACCGQP